MRECPPDSPHPEPGKLWVQRAARPQHILSHMGPKTCVSSASALSLQSGGCRGQPGRSTSCGFKAHSKRESQHSDQHPDPEPAELCVQRAAGPQHIMQTLLAKTSDGKDGPSMRVLDRLKLGRHNPLQGKDSGKSVKPGASPLQRVNQPNQARSACWQHAHAASNSGPTVWSQAIRVRRPGR